MDSLHENRKERKHEFEAQYRERKKYLELAYHNTLSGYLSKKELVQKRIKHAKDTIETVESCLMNEDVFDLARQKPMLVKSLENIKKKLDIATPFTKETVHYPITRKKPEKNESLKTSNILKNMNSPKPK
jgi:ribonuclease D